MATELKLRRGTTSQHSSFTGAEAEVTVDTDKETVVVHDGSAVGGYPVAREDMSNVTGGDPSFDSINVDSGTLFVDSANNRVGVGTSGNVTPNSSADDFFIDVNSNGGLSILTPDSSEGQVAFGSPSDAIGATIRWDYASKLMTIGTAATGGEIRFTNDNFTEAARIDSSGNLLVGTTSIPTGLTGGAGFIPESASRSTLLQASTTTSGTLLTIFRNPNGSVGTISTNGFSTSYNTSSDYRLKENVVDLTGAIDRVKSFKPSRFNFVTDPDKTVDGFLAHEAQEIVPEAVTGEKDAVDKDGNPEYQGIDQAKLVPVLTAALQEAVARIETLEAEVASLKNT